MAYSNDALSFPQLIASFRGGVLAQNADEEMRKVMELIAERGGSGELTVKLTIKKNKAGQMEITPKISSKTPDLPLGAGFYFADDDGGLFRNDPAQMDIEEFTDLQSRRPAAE